jgi:hypothetical protein
MEPVNTIDDMLRQMNEFGAHIMQITPCNKDDKPLYTVLVIEHPDAGNRRHHDVDQAR